VILLGPLPFNDRIEKIIRNDRIILNAAELKVLVGQSIGEVKFAKNLPGEVIQ
jgi:hypothetical protein